ncbi:MAG TPA: ABC transporter permease [Pilimelia sp.]|nr:ABC transporter permease [Pilimelia sp.]
MSDKTKLPKRFWIEAALAATTAILAIVTLISREWIEIVFHVDPDQGSGLLEWAIVIALGSATLLFSLLARAEWRHAMADPSR